MSLNRLLKSSKNRLEEMSLDASCFSELVPLIFSSKSLEHCFSILEFSELSLNDISETVCLLLFYTHDWFVLEFQWCVHFFKRIC